MGFGGVGVVEDGLAVGSDGVVVAVVDGGWGVVADAGVAVLVVVVVEELVEEVRAWARLVNVSGNRGVFFRVLNWASL